MNPYQCKKYILHIMEISRMEDLSYYNPEGSDLRKAQLRMLEMLEVLDTICRKHKIDYWLDWGTLLGARRHSGFIPWDDDIDVAVLQRDYKKLATVLKKELPQDLRLQTRQTDKKYFNYWAKIRDTKSRFHNKTGNVYAYNGISIDIFFIEPVPSLTIKSVIDRFLRSGYRFKKSRKTAHKINNALMFCFLPFMRILVWLLRFYYAHIGHAKVNARSYGGPNYTRYNMNHIFPVGEIMFEGKKFMAPHRVDAYLINQFGPTFMEIPEPSERIYHAVKIEFLS